ncbi:SbmA/BacA-like family transporter [Devosia aurantiaca]|uniref:Peptide transporter n=1 Tax=Devosia aurantiaca TaxID=2714858 RepID=A0A6M1SL61_9HYPH|nr:SbmA/BacA-like family transporter [Devosia aurantiaca]NGP17928.1 peptide transporter [Devosia aurantiaca]
MFRSFFPSPKEFFSSALLWMLLTTLIFQFAGNPVRSVISIDRFLAPAICAPDQIPAAETPVAPAPDALPAPEGGPTSTDPSAPAVATEQAAVPEPAATAVAAANCEAAEARFLNGPRIWEYWYILLCTAAFCAFWYFYKRNQWYWWSVVGSSALFLAVYSQVQLAAFLNDWQGQFFDILQQALSEPGSVSPDTFYPYVWTLFLVLLPNIIFLVLFAFFNSHYVFRWRKAMTSYYMQYWPSLRKVEGAAQRVQEDTMRFASIVEDLGTSFLGSLLSLVVFLPILWRLSQSVSEVPIIGQVPGSLVWVALVVAAFGTALLWIVGIRLPGLNFENQKVEAALRKELVYGEDQETRADPPSFRELFANVQKNYYRLYFHYTYFNLARYAYLQVAGYVPLLTLSPSILAGTITLGIYQQVQNAFGEVATSFQFFARSWTTIVELQSIYMRLHRFESFIPRDQEPIKEQLGDEATI